MGENAANRSVTLRNAMLALTVFLLPFQKILYLHVPVPLEDVVPIFSAAYLKVTDIPLLATLVLFLLTERLQFFYVPRHLRWLVFPTLGLIGLSVLSVWQARIPLLAIVLAVRLALTLGLVLCSIRVEPRRVIWPLVAAALVNALVGALQYALQRPLGLSLEPQLGPENRAVAVMVVDGVRNLRAYGLTAHPNVLAPYLVVAILLLAASALRRTPDEPRLESLASGLCAVGLAVSYSRAAWAGLLLGGGVLAAGVLLRRDMRPRLAALRGPLTAMLLVFGMFAAVQYRQIASRFGVDIPYFGEDAPRTGGEYGLTTSETDRALLLQDSITLFDTHPLRGIGGHNWSVEAERSRAITPAYSPGFQWHPVHNLAVLISTEVGILGGLLWVGLTVTPWVLAAVTWRWHGLDVMALGWLAISVYLAWDGLLDHLAWSLPEGMGLMWISWGGLGMALENCRRSEAIPQAVKPDESLPPVHVSPSSLTLPGISMDVGALRTVLSAYAIIRLGLLLVIFLSSSVIPPGIPQEEMPPPAFPDNALLDGLVRWDSFWYGSVVDGYSMPAGEQSNVAYLPGYPLVIRLLISEDGPIYPVGILVSNLALLAALAYLYALARREFDDETAARAVFYAAAAPASVFLSAVNPASLALLLIAAVFYHAGEGQWWRAGLMGALAAVTHPAGVLTAAVIAFEGWHREGTRAWRALPAAGLALAGAGVYVGYMAIRFGDPLAYVHAQAAWGHDVSGLGILRLVGNTISALHIGPGFLAGQVSSIVLIDTLMTLCLLPLVIVVAIRMRPAYGVFAALAFLLPLLDGTVLSMTYHALVLVPCFLLLADWGRRRWLNWLVAGISLPLMAYLAMLFSRWYWVG